MKNRIIVCSKTDLRVKKAVDRQSAKDFCRRVGCSYLEQCSNSSEGRDKLLQVPRASATCHGRPPPQNAFSTCSLHSFSTFHFLSINPNNFLLIASQTLPTATGLFARNRIAERLASSPPLPLLPNAPPQAARLEAAVMHELAFIRVLSLCMCLHHLHAITCQLSQARLNCFLLTHAAGKLNSILTRMGKPECCLKYAHVLMPEEPHQNCQRRENAKAASHHYTDNRLRHCT